MTRTLSVSFEIAWDDDESYRKLYGGLTEAITTNLIPSAYWCETTSFYIVETDEGPGALAARLWNTAGLRKTKDKLLVLDVKDGSGAAVGEFADQALFDLLPRVERLGWR